jgi:hypothetical protein
MSPALGFQYTVLRCVPRADREEFLNIGVLLYCQGANFLGVASRIDESRLAAFAPNLSAPAVRSALRAIDAVCRGADSAGASAALALGPRFGWLSAPRSTVVRPGPIHGGVTDDPVGELVQLLTAQVG